MIRKETFCKILSPSKRGIVSLFTFLSHLANYLKDLLQENGGLTPSRLELINKM